MKLRYLLLLNSFFLALLVQAQIKFLGEGRCEGTQITQADLDLLFVNAPDITWLDIKYTDSTLLLPHFKNLDILAIHSETLRSLVLPDALLKLSLIDFDLPNLTHFVEPIAPNLFQLTLYASLSSIPNLVCSSEQLTLLAIKNYQVIEWPQCMEDRFLNGQFNLSSCEIIDGLDGQTVSKIVSPDNTPDEWLESSDDISDEELKEFQKKMRKSERRIKLIRTAGRFVLAGTVFLILKS